MLLQPEFVQYLLATLFSFALALVCLQLALPMLSPQASKQRPRRVRIKLRAQELMVQRPSCSASSYHELSLRST